MTKQPQNNDNEKNTVKLSTPIEIDGINVTKITLKSPTAGECRGTNIMELLQLNVTAVSALLPRISTPALTPIMLSKMPLSDFAKLGMVLIYFLGGGEATD